MDHDAVRQVRRRRTLMLVLAGLVLTTQTVCVLRDPDEGIWVRLAFLGFVIGLLGLIPLSIAMTRRSSRAAVRAAERLPGVHRVFPVAVLPPAPGTYVLTADNNGIALWQHRHRRLDHLLTFAWQEFHTSGDTIATGHHVWNFISLCDPQGEVLLLPLAGLQSATVEDRDTLLREITALQSRFRR